MVKKKKKFVRKRRRNPADVRAGIKAEFQPVTREGQRTASRKEVETFKRTGVGTTEQRAAKKAAEQKKETTPSEVKPKPQPEVKTSEQKVEVKSEPERKEPQVTSAVRQQQQERKDFGGIAVREAPQPKSLTEKLRAGLGKLRGKERSAQEQGKLSIKSVAGGLAAGLGTSALGTFTFAKSVILEPVKTAKSIPGAAKQLAFEARTGILQEKIRTVIKTQPAFATGFIGTELATAKGLGAASKKVPVKIRKTTTKIPTSEKVPTLKSISESGIILDKPTKVSKPIKISTVGLEVRSRGVPLVSKTPEGFSLGKPKVSQQIKLGSLTEPIAAPVTASGTKSLTSVLELSKPEAKRVQSVIRSTRILKGEKGARVKDVVFDIEPLKKTRQSSKIIESLAKGEEGVFFGSTVSLQLPKKFRTITPGSDIDVVFPKRTVEQLTPKISQTAQRLRGIGEDVRVSRKNPLVIESPKGEKILEAKSGINQDLLPGESPAPVGGLGFEFGNLRLGQVRTTVKFGEAKAITIGEQLSRKGVASIFFRGEDIAAPKAFRGAGVLPPGRRTKDIPGFILTGRGTVELRKTGLSRVRPIKRFRTAVAEKSIEDFLGSFTKGQQTEIGQQISDIKRINVPLESGKKTPSPTRVSPLPKFESPGIVSPSVSPTPSSISSVISKSPSPSKSPSISSIISGSPSPSKFSKSPSPFKSPSPPKKPSPSFKSPTPPSNINSLFKSPSPSPSPSPFKPSPSPKIIDSKLFIPKPRKGLRFDSDPFQRREKKLRKRRIPSREFKFTPSLVALDLGLTGKRKKLEEQVLTGLEIRPIPI